MPRPPGTRAAVQLFLATRVLLWTVAVIVLAGFPELLNPNRGTWDSGRMHDLGRFVDVWARWDSDWYIKIAQGWYDWPSGRPAFFPLYPSVIAALAKALGSHAVLSGVVASLIAGTIAAALLHRLVARKLGEDVALRAVLYLAIFPTSLFLGAVYSESLFLALAIGTFVAAERGRLGWASVLAGLALLTRSQGVALLPALAWFVWRSPRPRRNGWLLGVPPVMFSAYPLVLWVCIGHPFAFLEAQQVTWQRSFDLFAPITAPFHGLVGGEAVEAVFAFSMIALAAAAYRLVGVPYGLYATVALWLPLAYPSTKGWLYSFPRLSLAAFPCLIALAVLTARPRAQLVVSTVLAAGLVTFVVRWALWEWVA
ncbi:MAG: mannosyltransferase family protein [Gaiellales bacterium]